jgi:polysaccharide deacetylase family protein (PEP-CTERM system associated)
MVNALSVDVEDYFHVSCLEKQIGKGDWPSFPSRIGRNVDRVLELLNKTRVRATFFVLGWVADHHPSVVREIAQAGHELGCHSYWHRLVYEMTAEEFVQDTLQAKAAIEDASGMEVTGYRAPSYSITRESEWALDILLELGFRYDSSIFPIEHDRYGWLGTSRFATAILQSGNKTLWEFPPSTYPLFGRAVPIAGGGYLRILPYNYMKWALEYVNLEEQREGCVYFHPWEIDSEQPRLLDSTVAWWRHSVGISGMETKLARLLEDFKFAPLGEVLRTVSCESGGNQGNRSGKCIIQT